MKRITNREEANFYYKKMNDLVKKYSSSKARPSEVRRFIENNLDRILNREGLSDVLGIERVVDDVLDHHCSIESDGIMTFEKFTFLEGDSNLSEHERYLGDLFDCDLDSVKLKNGEINLFEVSSFGDVFEVFVFSKEEFEFVRSNLIDKLVNEFGEDFIPLSEIESINLDSSIRFKISDIWNESLVRRKFENEFSESRFLKFLPLMISTYLNLSDKVNLVCSPPDHKYYVYCIGDYDLIFKLSDKLM